MVSSISIHTHIGRRKGGSERERVIYEKGEQEKEEEGKQRGKGEEDYRILYQCKIIIPI